MTCGTHTTTNVTAAAFGFNPLLSGSFLKRLDMTAVNVRYAAFQKKKKKKIPPTPPTCRVQQARPAAQTHTDCHSHSRFFFFFSPFTLTLLFSFVYFASWPTAVRVRWTRRSWCPLCALLWRPWKLVALFRHLSRHRTHQLHLPDARLLPTRTASSARVCMCVCVCACVCVYIYIKRESNIYESIFFLFCDESY